MKSIENFVKGIFKENPIAVSLLGICPALAVTTKLENALGLGWCFIFVLTFSNLIVSLIRNITPKEIRIPVFIIIIAAFVTIIEMLIKAFLPSLSKSLGLFISLIAVNCIVLGRAEAFASKNKPIDSVIDGIGMGIGYTLLLTIISLFREILSNGTISVWGDIVINIKEIFNLNDTIFSGFYSTSAGAYFAIGFLFIIINLFKIKYYKKEEKNGNI